MWTYNFIVTRNVAFKIRVTFSESKVDSAAWKLLIIRLIKFHLPEETSKVLTTFSIDIQDILLKDSICLFSWRWFLSLFLHCVQTAWEFTTLVCRQIKRFQSNRKHFSSSKSTSFAIVKLGPPPIFYKNKKNPEGWSRTLLIYLVWN